MADWPSPPPSRSPSPLFDSAELASRTSSISSAGGDEPQHIKLPRRLPRPQCQQPTQPLELEPELRGVPLPFIREAVRAQGPSLLAACNATTITLPPSAELIDLPSALPCTFAADLPTPTHLLAITFRDATARRILVPAHGLSLALASPLLAPLSAPNPFLSPSQPSSFHRPIVHFSLPSSLSYGLLHEWIYLQSPERLTQALETSASGHPVKKAALLHGLWANVTALQMDDEVLWTAMDAEWESVLKQLGSV